MKLRSEPAQQICELVARELNVGVLLTAEDGRIIAASDKQRIGATHEIGARIMAGEFSEQAVTADAATAEGYCIALDYGGQRFASLEITAPIDVATRFVRPAKHWILSHLEATHAEQIYDDMLERQVKAHTADLEGELTERKRAEVALRESQTTLRTVIENVGHGITLFDGNMNLVAWNGRFANLLDYPPEMVREGAPLESFFRYNAERGEYGPGDIEELVATRVAKARQMEPHAFERVRNDGTVIEITGTMTPSGGFVRTYADVTERRWAESALRQSESRLRAIMDNVADGIISIDQNGLVEAFNQSAERMFGYSLDEIRGKNIKILMPDPYHSEHDGYLRAHSESGINRVVGSGSREIVAKRRDGSIFPIDLAISQTLLGDRRVFVGIVRDITVRKNAEKEKDALEANLRQAQKLEALGTLAGGVAHEINTPTQYVGDNIRFLQEAFNKFIAVLEKSLFLAAAAQSSNQFVAEVAALEKAMADADLSFQLSEVPSSLRQSLDGIERIREIVLAIKEFSHPDVKEKSTIDLNRAIETTITVSRNQWKYVAELTTDFADNLPPVPCLPGEFNQVMLNLIVNAAHAIEEAKTGAPGRIVITTRAVDGWVEIRVSDTGTGIKTENQERVFDMFYTTKPPGKGTGQGLAICHTIITQKHGGTITLDSEEGRGTTFIVRLPLVPPQPEQAAAA
jgi:PAS domain S-box-containing protein